MTLRTVYSLCCDGEGCDTEADLGVLALQQLRGEADTGNWSIEAQLDGHDLDLCPDCTALRQHEATL